MSPVRATLLLLQDQAKSQTCYHHQVPRLSRQPADGFALTQ